MLPFIMAESIKEDLSLSDTQVGLLTGIAFAVCYAVFSLPLARVSDRGSPRFVLVSCALVWSAMTALGAFAESFLFLALTRFGVALGEAGGSPAAHAIIARRIRPERRGLAIGIFSLSLPFGTMVAFALGGAITDTHGWRATVLGAGAFGALCHRADATTRHSRIHARAVSPIKPSPAIVGGVPLVVRRRSRRRLCLCPVLRLRGTISHPHPWI